MNWTFQQLPRPCQGWSLCAGSSLDPKRDVKAESNPTKKGDNVTLFYLLWLLQSSKLTVKLVMRKISEQLPATVRRCSKSFTWNWPVPNPFQLAVGGFQVPHKDIHKITSSHSIDSDWNMLPVACYSLFLPCFCQGASATCSWRNRGLTNSNPWICSGRSMAACRPPVRFWGIEKQSSFLDKPRFRSITHPIILFRCLWQAKTGGKSHVTPSG